MPVTNAFDFLRSTRNAQLKCRCPVCDNDLGTTGSCRAGATMWYCDTHADTPSCTLETAGYCDPDSCDSTTKPTDQDQHVTLNGYLTTDRWGNDEDQFDICFRVNAYATDDRYSLTCNNCGTNLRW